MYKELREILTAHAGRYPAMGPQDGVKLVYQNEFGGGHLVSDPEQSLERLRTEWAAVDRAPNTPLAEEIGNGMVRIQLRGMDGAEYPLEALNRDFIRSAAARRGSMTAFLEKLDVLRGLAGEQASLDSPSGSWRTIWGRTSRRAVPRCPTARRTGRRTVPPTG